MKKLLETYSTFIKYIFASGTSFVLDLVLFTIFTHLLKGIIDDYAIFVGTICARIISSFYNYLMNRNAVFKSGKMGMDMPTFTKYYVLVAVQMLVSSFLVFFGHRIFHVSETLVKIPVDIFLFMINYFVQKMFIFRKQ